MFPYKHRAAFESIYIKYILRCRPKDPTESQIIVFGKYNYYHCETCSKRYIVYFIVN